MRGREDELAATLAFGVSPLLLPRVHGGGARVYQPTCRILRSHGLSCYRKGSCSAMCLSLITV